VKNKVQTSRNGATIDEKEETPQIIINRIENRRGRARQDHLVFYHSPKTDEDYYAFEKKPSYSFILAPTKRKTLPFGQPHFPRRSVIHTRF
jgi:hypothetical protein